MSLRAVVRTVATALFALSGGCTTFSAARPADVSLGPSYHAKFGLGQPGDPAVSWFSDFSDCVLCKSSPVAQTEIGYTHGWRAKSGRKYTAGVFLDGLAPQVDLYAQRRESATSNLGYGVRAGATRH